VKSIARFPSRRLKYAAVLNSEALSESTDADFELAYIDIGNVDSQGRIHDIVNYRFEDAPSRARRIVRDGDVIISTVRTYLQAIAPVERPSANLIVSTGFAVVRPLNILDHRFCKFAVRTNRFLWEVESRSTGVSYPAITASDLANINISLPELTAQRLIADYLDRETARIDRLIAEKTRMLALLEEKRAALISRIVTRGLDPNAPMKLSGHEWLGEIPAHWALQRLKQLAEVRGGLTLGKQYSGELLEYPYLRVANVQDGYLKLDGVLTVEVPASDAALNLLANGDVLMNEGGDIDKLGRGCVWRDEIKPCLHQNHVFAVRPHSVDSDWLALWTSTIEAKRYFESRAKRSTNLASISGSNVKELPVPLPPIGEQTAILEYLAGRHARLEKIRSEIRASLLLLTERRAAVITAAVTGQIPVEGMQDEIG
jgi:type I restriction enzyme S subunit